MISDQAIVPQILNQRGNRVIENVGSIFLGVVPFQPGDFIKTLVVSGIAYKAKKSLSDKL